MELDKQQQQKTKPAFVVAQQHGCCRSIAMCNPLLFPFPTSNSQRLKSEIQNNGCKTFDLDLLHFSLQLCSWKLGSGPWEKIARRKVAESCSSILSLQRCFKRVYIGKEKGSPRSPNCECKEAICLPKINHSSSYWNDSHLKEKNNNNNSSPSPVIEGIQLTFFFQNYFYASFGHPPP